LVTSISNFNWATKRCLSQSQSTNRYSGSPVYSRIKSVTKVATYKCEKKISVFILRVSEFYVDKLLRHALTWSQDASPFERAHFVDETDGLLSPFAYRKVLLVMTKCHCGNSLCALHAYSREVC